MNSRTIVTLGILLLSGCFTPVEEYVPSNDGVTQVRPQASTPAPADFSIGASAVPATLPSAPPNASDASTPLPFDAGVDAGTPTVFDAGIPFPVPIPPSGRQTIALTRVAGATRASESSLAFKLDRAGSPVLAFVRTHPQRRDVVVADWSGTAWRETVVDSAPNAGGLSMAIDAHGTRHLAYSVTHPAPGQLKYARLSHDGGVVHEVVLNMLLGPPWPSTVTDLERTDLLAADTGEVLVTYLRLNLPRLSSRTATGSWNETTVATGHATLPRLVWNGQKPLVAVYFGFWTGLYLHERQGTA